MARKGIYPESVKPGIPKLGDKPKNWQEVSLSEILSVVIRKADIEDDVEYQLVNAKRNREGIAAREVLPGKKILTKTQFYIKQGDFLIANRQIVHGACGVVPKELDGALVSNEYTVLHPVNGLLLDFLRYYTHTIYFQQTCFQSSVGVDVEKMIFRVKDWFKYKIHIPPEPEQQRIARILSCWDRAIELTEKLIQEKTKLKKGLMQQLLVGKKRISGHGHEIWKSVTLGDVCEFKGGNAFKKVYQGNKEGDYPFIKVSDMSLKENSIFINNSTNWVPKSVQKEIKAFLFPANTIVFAKVGAAIFLNKRRILTRKTIIDNNMMGAIPKKSIYHFFLYYFLVNIDFCRLIQEGALPSINQSILSSINISLPSLVEQQKIASVLSTCDKEIEILNKRLDALKQQKKGLMQKLLTGKVRVKVDHEPSSGGDA